MEESKQAPSIRLPSFKDVQKRSVEKSRLQSSFRPSSTTKSTSGNSNASIINQSTAPSSTSPAYFIASAQQPGTSATARKKAGHAGSTSNLQLPPSSAPQTNACEPVLPYQTAQNVRGQATPVAQVPSKHFPDGQQQGVSRQTYSSPSGQGNPLLVNGNQHGNPVLKHVRNVNYQFADVAPDFQFSDQVAGVFLSLKFHRLKPHYMASRVKMLNREFRTFLICLCDIEDPVNPLAEISQQAVDMHLTLIVAFSEAECGRYLELLKAYGNKAVDALKPQTETDYVLRVARILTHVRGVNRTDSALMGSECRSLAAILRLTEDEMRVIPGIGHSKSARLLAAFDTPFYIDQKKAEVVQNFQGVPNSDTAASNDKDLREWVATQQAGDAELSEDDIV